MGEVPAWEYLAVGLCLALSAYFSACETALTSLGDARARHMLEEKVGRGSAIRLWVERPTRILTAILVGNNLVNVTASALATHIASILIPSTAVPVAIGITTLLLLVFGEVVPKSLARASAARFAASATHLLTAFYFVAYPLVWTLYQITRGVAALTGGSLKRSGPTVTEAEIEHLVRIGQEEGEIEKGEKEMITAVLEFGDTTVKEAMIPRTEVVGIEVGVGFEDLRREVVECGHSRIPVFRENLASITGVLYVKDLLRPGAAGGRGFDLASILRPAYFVPETKKIDDLLKEFQKGRVHLAIVVDEYGGTSGIITMEDILEELVGEINDEYDDVAAPLVRAVGEGEYEADAAVNLYDLGKVLGEEFPEQQDYDTLGGFVTHECGCVPEAGREFEWERFLFRVIAAQPTKVERVSIRVLDAKKDGAGEKPRDSGS